MSKLDIGGVARRLSIEENQLVTDMYSLWHVRCCWKQVHLEDRELVGVLAPSPSWSEDDREQVEKHNLLTCNTSGANVILPGRHIAGILIQRDWSRVRNALQDCLWRIVESMSGEFIVPDNSRVRLVLPVSPRVCFTMASKYSIISEADLRQINALFKLGSEQYYFGSQL